MNNISMHNDERASFIAGADITENTPLKLDTSAENTVIPATAGDEIIGFARDTVDDTFVVGIKDRGYWQAVAGAGGWANGDKLKVGASGVLIVVTDSADVVVAIAIDTTTATETGEIKIVPQLSLSALSGILTADITLLTAEVLVLNGTPIQLILAPGAGKAIVVDYVISSMDYAGVAYATNTDLEIRYDSSAGDAGGAEVTLDSLDALLLLTADAVYKTPGLGSDVDTALTINKGVSAIINTGNPTAGTSDIKLKLVYRVITI